MYILSNFPKKVKKMKSTSETITDFVMFLAIVAFIVIVCIVYMKVLKPQKIEAEPELVATPIEQEESVVYKAKPVFEEEKAEKHEIVLTDEELMARVVHKEAEVEPMIGKVAVVSVILNRCDAWGETVESVIFEKDQFTISDTYTDDDMRAVEIAQKVRDLFPQNMIYFRNQHFHTFGTPYMVIGGHYFSIDEKLESEETE